MFVENLFVANVETFLIGKRFLLLCCVLCRVAKLTLRMFEWSKRNVEFVAAEEENLAANSVHAEKDSKPMKTDESEPANYNTEMDGDSNFFTYFMLLCIIFIVAYVCYHNKQKVTKLGSRNGWFKLAL